MVVKLHLGGHGRAQSGDPSYSLAVAGLRLRSGIYRVAHLDGFAPNQRAKRAYIGRLLRTL